MKTIKLGVGLATVLSCLSGISYGACTISSIQGGTIVGSVSNNKLLSSKSTGGTAGSFTISQCNNQTLSVAAPVATGSNNPSLSSSLSEIYEGSTLRADSSGQTYKIPTNTAKTYSTHMTITASNPLLPGSYSYRVRVTIVNL